MPELSRSAAASGDGSTVMTERFDPLVPCVGFGVLAVASWLYTYHTGLYQYILNIWMLQPFPAPFLDLSFVTAGIDCWGKGVDVYEHNPCDLLDRTHNYSPLWLRLAFIPTGAEWTNILGLGLVGCFLIALGFLPLPRRASLLGASLLGVLSYSTAYAVERGNLDLLMFTAAIVAGLCLGGRLPARIAGYALITFISLLKFYPAVMLVVLLRERWRVIIAVGCLAAAAFAGFVVMFHDELPRMAATLPVTWPPGFGWGAKGLPRGLNDILPNLLGVLGYHASWVDGLQATHLAAFIFLIVLMVVSFGTALHLAHRTDMIASLDLLPPRASRFLLIGSAAVGGCFFLGESLPYRAIFLLLVLPVFLVLVQVSPHIRVRKLFGWTAGATLFVLWQHPIRGILKPLFGGPLDPPPGPVFQPAKELIATYIGWVVTELSWWWVITVLMAVLLRFLASLRPGAGARAHIVPASTSP